MRYDRQRWCWAGVFLGTLVLLTGCAYDATVRGCRSRNRPSGTSIRKS